MAPLTLEVFGPRIAQPQTAMAHHPLSITSKLNLGWLIIEQEQFGAEPNQGPTILSACVSLYSSS